MLRSEQRRPSCAVPASVASVTTPYFDLPQLTLLTGGGGYIRRGVRRHALKLALTGKRGSTTPGMVPRHFSGGLVCALNRLT